MSLERLLLTTERGPEPSRADAFFDGVILTEHELLHEISSVLPMTEPTQPLRLGLADPIEWPHDLDGHGPEFENLAGGATDQDAPTTGPFLASDDGVAFFNLGDLIEGTDENDIIGGSPGNDTIYGFAGNDEIAGGDGNDEIHGGDGYDNLYGGNGNDLVFGGEGTDLILSGKGSDTVYGEGGDDVIWDVGGNSELFGGPGDDHITPGKGNDTVSGGDGADTFLFAPSLASGGNDLITDFEIGVDTLKIANIDSDFSGLSFSEYLDGHVFGQPDPGVVIVWELGNIRLQGVSIADLTPWDIEIW